MMRIPTLLIVCAILISCNRNTKIKTEIEAKKIERNNPSNVNQSDAENGIVFFSDNNGNTWKNKSKGLPDNVNTGLGSIAVSEDLLGIAIKEEGIFLFDFQKDIWVKTPTDDQIIKSNIGPLAFFNGQIFVGTEKSGVFSTKDSGKNWINYDAGLASPTIRKLIQIDNKLYAGTNSGLYTFNETDKKWELEYGNSKMQVNGMTDFDGSIYIGTNQGAFATVKGEKKWKQILANRTLHNISSGDNTIYAMVYNELLSSKDKGESWQNIQNGLPKELYTFNIFENGKTVFAGQWDGVYRKDNSNDNWKSYSSGLPGNLAITNMNIYQGIIVVGGNHRELKKGMTTDKWLSYNNL